MFSIVPVTQPSADTKHPLLLFQSLQGEKYLFGRIPEGTQRAINEKKIKLNKLQHVFLTGTMNWSSVGGLPGLILTLADQGKDKLHLHYGNNLLLNFIIATWRLFIFRFGINLSTNNMLDSSFKDKAITVNSIVFKPSNAMPKPYNTQITESATNKIVSEIVNRMFPILDSEQKNNPSNDFTLNIDLFKGSNYLNEKTLNHNLTTCYEIKCNPVRGKFKLDEAVKLNIPFGPIRGKLTKGESVTLEDGTVVHPHQVMDPDQLFSTILIIDIPSNDYLPKMISYFNEKYNIANIDNIKGLSTVYYLLDEKVEFNKEIIDLMEVFPANVKHVFSHVDLCKNSLTYKSSAITTLKLKLLQNDSFNLPITNQGLNLTFFNTFQKGMSNETKANQISLPLPAKINVKNVYILDSNEILQIDKFSSEQSDGKPMITKVEESTKMISTSNDKYTSLEPWDDIFHDQIVPILKTNAFSDSSKTNANQIESEYKRIVQDQVNVDNFNNTEDKSCDVEVVTLGTGSALPSKYRNVLSTLIKVPYKRYKKNKVKEISQRYMFFDIGENTIGTLQRMFKPEKLVEIFKDLKLIYLSHLHADHHLGIISVLKFWFQVNASDSEKKIFLVLPWQYNKFVEEWLTFESPELLERIHYISNEHLKEGYVFRENTFLNLKQFNRFAVKKKTKKKKKANDMDYVEILKKRKIIESTARDYETIALMKKELNLVSFKTCRAIHCSWAYSNMIQFKLDSEGETFKLSYSGDTRPNIKLFAKGIGRNSDLLLHEATLDNELQEDAEKKRHCTINEAIEVSNAMNVNKLILTHFSQRYPKVPSISGNITIHAKEYCFAFDGMIIQYSKLGDQMQVLQHLGIVFKSEQEDVEEHDLT